MSVAAFAIALCSSGGLQATEPQRANAVTASLELFSKEIVVFGPENFLYGFRERARIPARELAPVREFWRFLEGGNWKADDFLPLLQHRNAKVRTLALAGLYNLEDPTLLPKIFPLVKDGADTFPAMQRFANYNPETVKLTPDMTYPQTVGEIATEILNVYMKSAGYLYGPLGLGGEPGFEEYWKVHAGRSSSAGWWAVRLARAGQATSPTPKERYQPIRTLRAQIDKLPEPDHTYVLLRLNGEFGSDVLVTPEELVGLLKKHGPDSLMDLLKRRIRSNDPDLQPSRKKGDASTGSMGLFILQHAGMLLRRTDAKVLLDQETWERDFQKHGITDPMISPWWAIGAAQLNDKDAVSILKDAYTRFQGQYDSVNQLELSKALWRLTGEKQAPTVVDWFYKELAHPYGQESNALDELLTTGRQPVLLAKAFIDDRRFDDLNWKSIEVLAKKMNSWSGREVIPEEEFQSTSSPMSSDFFMKDKSKALEQYPKETGELLAKLARWRAALRESLPALTKK